MCIVRAVPSRISFKTTMTTMTTMDRRGLLDCPRWWSRSLVHAPSHGLRNASHKVRPRGLGRADRFGVQALAQPPINGAVVPVGAVALASSCIAWEAFITTPGLERSNTDAIAHGDFHGGESIIGCLLFHGSIPFHWLPRLRLTRSEGEHKMAGSVPRHGWEFRISKRKRSRPAGAKHGREFLGKKGSGGRTRVAELL